MSQLQDLLWFCSPSDLSEAALGGVDLTILLSGLLSCSETRCWNSHYGHSKDELFKQIHFYLTGKLKHSSVMQWPLMQ